MVQTMYGGFPLSGYTMFLANGTFQKIVDDPWMGPHYYNVTYYDLDNTTTQMTNHTYSQNWYGQWMTGWGGNYRFYYLDLAAGYWNPAGFGGAPHMPWAINWNTVGTLGRYWFTPLYGLFNDPLQAPTQPILNSSQGINTMTLTLGNFAQSIVKCLHTPDFVYPPRMAETIDVPILIFDNSTNYWNYTLFGSNSIYGVNKSLIERALKNIIPYANWNVTLQYIHLNGPGMGDPQLYEDLWNAIKKSTYRKQDPYGAIWNVVELEPIHYFLQNNLNQLVSPSSANLTLPVFAFVFQDSYNLATDWKGFVSTPNPNQNDPFTFWGMALYDMALVSRSFWDLSIFGAGMTQTIIHEVGHQIGIVHPFQYDWVMDFSATTMGYYTWEYNYSVFDVDLLRRAHADYYLIKAQDVLDEINIIIQSRIVPPTFTTHLTSNNSIYAAAQMWYGLMDYNASRVLAQAAYLGFLKLLQEALNLPPMDGSPPVIYDLEISPVPPQPDTDIVITFKAGDYTGVKNVTVYYLLNGAGNWTIAQIAMNGVFIATIPGQPDGTAVTFYVEAYDFNGIGGTTINYTYWVLEDAPTFPGPELPGAPGVSLFVVLPHLAGTGAVGIIVGLLLSRVMSRNKSTPKPKPKKSP
jgi:hypothetical protein